MATFISDDKREINMKKEYYRELIIWGIIITIIGVLALIREEEDWLTYIFDKKSYEIENVTVNRIESESKGLGAHFSKKEYIYFNEYENAKVRRGYNDYVGKSIVVGKRYDGKIARVFPIIPPMSTDFFEEILFLCMGIFLIIFGYFPHQDHSQDMSLEKREKIRTVSLLIGIITLIIGMIIIFVFIV